MRWLRNRRTAPALSPRETRTIWQVCSLLLDYPDETLLARVPTLRQALAEVPGPAAGELTAYLDDFSTTDLVEAQAEYVDTFDVTRKCALHLTYFTNGDTRRRGVALVEVKQAYRRAGLELEGGELPDYLPAVLEFGAAYDLDAAWKLINDHRVAIELLHRALARRGSPWLRVVEALRHTLPVLDGSDEEALARLIAAGPPQEQVGLDSYSLDPRLNPRPEPIDLGDAIPVGAPR